MTIGHFLSGVSLVRSTSAVKRWGMKKVFEIFKHDFHAVFTNVWATVIVIGIMVIPALYAWFNINSNWDPYSATSGIKIAVANDDKGAEIEGMNLNVGSMIVDELAKNDSIGWQFVDEKQAMKGVDDGSYYAAIVIPEDFSASIGSIAQLAIEKPEIKYYVNEKKNAIAPKITNTGVNTVQVQVNEAIVETASNILSTLAKKVVGEADTEGQSVAEKATAALKEVDDSLQEYEDLLAAVSSACDTLSQSVGSVKGLLPGIKTTANMAAQAVDDASGLLSDSKSTAAILSNSIAGSLDSAVSISSALDAQVQQALDLADEPVDQAQSSAKSMLNKASTLASSALSQNQQITSALQNLQQAAGGRLDILSDLISRLDERSEKLTSLQTDLDDGIGTIDEADALGQQQKETLLEATSELADLSKEMQSTYNNNIRPDLLKLFDTLDNSLKNLSALEGTDTLSGSVEESINSMQGAIESSQGALEKTAGLMKNARSKLQGYMDQISGLEKNEKVQNIEDLLSRDPELVAAFMKEPVAVDTISVYPIANYGSGMAPFYTTLAIWVGALVNCAIMKTEVRGKSKKQGKARQKTQAESAQQKRLDAALQSHRMAAVHSGAHAQTLQHETEAARTLPSQAASIHTSQPESGSESKNPEGEQSKQSSGTWNKIKNWTVKGIKNYHQNNPAGKSGYTPDQEYFGRYLFFAFVSVSQALIICLGDLFIFHIQCLHPVLFLLMGVVTAISFSLLMYTLTVSFGDVGKAIAVIIMVVQVAGSGGTFPIEVLPKLYQHLYPWFPFNYAINGMRECIAGLYGNTYWHDVLLELCYIPFSLVIGLALRKPIMNLKEYIESRVKKTGFIG